MLKNAGKQTVLVPIDFHWMGKTNKQMKSWYIFQNIFLIFLGELSPLILLFMNYF